MMPQATESSFESLSRKLGNTYDAIAQARAESTKALARLDDVLEGLTTTDTAFVVFGSLARKEWTSGSDLDWTLLIDGQADPQHRRTAQEFARRAEKANFPGPGRAGIFGNLSFSHDLIHWIGGENDTNMNMTRRLLLVLESASLDIVDARSRVLSGILSRYLEYERTFLAETGRKYKVPRFLLNDIVRYWRTMAVDYVNKQWERGDQGWALRNIKLRFSRKLIFVSGLLTCFSPFIDPAMRAEETLWRDENEAAQSVHRYIVQRIGRTPMDVLCSHLEAHARAETADAILSAYDVFLERLDDTTVREHLDSLRPGDAYADSSFRELRGQSHRFQEGLIAMLYSDNERVRDLMYKYGVF